MRFTVMWHPAAEQELADIWLRAVDRSDVTQAANQIDQAPASEPLAKGEDFYGNRLLVVVPLAVTYTVNEQDRTVLILQVWHR
jgi:plasmid stabilization system protein ParE